ncbi:Response regulator BaeR [Pseudoalteromonas luteoviolacea B = ATCC 29581]|nr:Response regulator BaeR [Pseudoalteromonas luteoviolacea B = ATCC 29581]
MNEKILVVEDERKLADVLTKYLTQSGFSVITVYNGKDALDTFEKEKPDLILLDLMLPNVDGITICKHIRQSSNVPIIMTTAKVEEVDRLLGLELGADDYVCKPYSPREVVARVNAIMRRIAFLQTPVASQREQGLIINEETLFASYQGLKVSLTAVEFHLLKKLVNHPGRVYSREQLMDTIYDDDRIVSDRTIDSHIKKVRKKLIQIAPQLEFIQSIYGVGYKYEPA